jgi:hypothetical protein
MPMKPVKSIFLLLIIEREFKEWVANIIYMQRSKKYGIGVVLIEANHECVCVCVCTHTHMSSLHIKKTKDQRVDMCVCIDFRM